MCRVRRSRRPDADIVPCGGPSWASGSISSSLVAASSTTPGDFYDVCKLLEFATDLSKSGTDWGTSAIASILENILEGLRTARCDERAAAREELKAERAKGHAEGRAYIREIFEISDKMDERRREREAASP
jgi:hypothetical protein